jgi:hypothetical protein
MTYTFLAWPGPGEHPGSQFPAFEKNDHIGEGILPRPELTTKKSPENILGAFPY